MAIHFLTGDDSSVLRAATTTLVHELVGDGDRTLLVDEFDGDEFDLGAAIDAAQTPPFLTEFRVVVARDVAKRDGLDVAPLVGYLGEPLDSTELVVEWGSGRVPKALDTALKAAKATLLKTSPPKRANDRAGWISDAAKAAGVKLSTDAVRHLAAHLGEDAGSLDGVLRTLASTYGAGKQLGVGDVEPFLGDAGGVPPWDLTDAIDAGKTAAALDMLQRMVGSGGRHPLQVMAILQGNYLKLAALDGANARSEADAAAVLGIKPGYPARKAMETSRRLGGRAIKRAVELLAAADLDLRGRTSLEGETVLEILVARLSKLRR